MKIKYVKALFAALIAITLAFIFIQSMLPPEKSSAESDAVGGIIADIIPPDTELGGFAQKNLRKLAHFTEFFILGAEAALAVVIVIERKIKYAVHSLPAAALVALSDESIQLFSGRGPSIADVWIDVLGFASASVIIYTVYALTRLIYIKCKHKSSK